MIKSLKHFLKQRSKRIKHKRKTENLKLKRERVWAKCVAKYGGHLWEGDYYTNSGLTCKHCGHSKRCWTFANQKWDD